jgi:hypothetical protein
VIRTNAVYDSPESWSYAHLYEPDAFIAECPRHAEKVVGGPDELLCPAQEAVACGRQHDARAYSLEERHADFLLELANVATQRRLGDVQSLRGPCEVELLGDNDESAQMTEVHIGRLCRIGINMIPENALDISTVGSDGMSSVFGVQDGTDRVANPPDDDLFGTTIEGRISCDPHLQCGRNRLESPIVSAPARALEVSMKTFGLVFVLSLLTAPLDAQWLKIPTPGIPRTADGQPDLSAPAPRTAAGTPDLSGIWQRPRGSKPPTGGNDGIATGIEVLFQPWAEALYKERAVQNSKGTPSERCLPHGITKAVSVPEPFKIVQTSDLILVLHEEFNHYRQIFMDGRRPPGNRAPTWLGHSGAKWDGDTLVVDTTGFVDETWLDFRGHPATDALHLVERYRRTDFGHLQIQFTIDDPKAYVKPWNVTMLFDLLPETELIEHICENEKDAALLVGK